MKKKLLFILIAASSINNIAKAQFEVTNNGDNVYVVQGEQVYVRGNGSIENLGSGLFDNRGSIFMNGDWKNDGTTLGFVNNRPTGTLILDGADQRMYGTNSTRFNNLTLTGTGIKFVNVNCSNEDTLTLNDRELRLGANVFTVLNNNPTAIKRVVAFDENTLAGFVSATNGGYLARRMDSVNDYIFPMGDIVEGSPRYRPMAIRPTQVGTQSYGVRLANVDATTETYDRDVKQEEICRINPDFYHQVFRLANGGPVDLNFAFDANADIVKQFMAHWLTTGPIWTQIIPSVELAGLGSQLSFFNIAAWSDFRQNAFAMGNQATNAVFSYTPVTPNANLPVTFSAGFLPGQTYTWDFGDGQTGTGLNINHVFTQPGEYTVTLTTNNGNDCPDVYTQKIIIPKRFQIFDPTGVTPNGDGVNDNAYIHYIGYDVARMSIFDRWGVLFREIETTTSPLIWDCKDKNGNVVQEDAYVYRIDATRPDGTVDVITNTITVVR